MTVKYCFRFAWRPFGGFQGVHFYKEWEFDTRKERDSFASKFPKHFPFDYSYYVKEIKNEKR